MDEFKIDISEDYDDLKDDEDFIHLLGDTFLLEDAKIEQEPLINEELLQRDCEIEVDNFDSIIGDILQDNLIDDLNSNDSEVVDDVGVDVDVETIAEVDVQDNVEENLNRVVNEVVEKIINEAVKETEDCEQLESNLNKNLTFL